MDTMPASWPHDRQPDADLPAPETQTQIVPDSQAPGTEALSPSQRGTCQSPGEAAVQQPCGVMVVTHVNQEEAAAALAPATNTAGGNREAAAAEVPATQVATALAPATSGAGGHEQVANAPVPAAGGNQKVAAALAPTTSTAENQQVALAPAPATSTAGGNQQVAAALAPATSTVENPQVAVAPATSTAGGNREAPVTPVSIASVPSAVEGPMREPTVPERMLTPRRPTVSRPPSKSAPARSPFQPSSKPAEPGDSMYADGTYWKPLG